MNKDISLIKLNWKFAGAEHDKLPSIHGVYQIYGDSPIYGRNVLLYIGKANNLNTRIDSHIENEISFITRQPNKSYYFAEVSESELDMVEQILIVMHKPSFNSRNIIEIGAETKKGLILIHNYGERGMLHLEVSNYFFL